MAKQNVLDFILSEINRPSEERQCGGGQYDEMQDIRCECLQEAVRYNSHFCDDDDC